MLGKTKSNDIVPQAETKVTIPQTETKAQNIVAFDRSIFDQLAQIHGGTVNPWDLPSYTMPGKGGEAFGTIDGSVEKMEVVILHHHSHRRLYREGFDGSERQPDCICYDSAPETGAPIGFGNPDGDPNAGDAEHDCNTCKYSEWGSNRLLPGKTGKGKACSDRKLMIVAVKGQALPCLFDLPPTAVKTFSKFATAQLSHGRNLHRMVIEMSLKDGKLQMKYLCDNDTPDEILGLAAATIPKRPESTESDW